MAKPKAGKAASLFEKLLDTEPGIKVKLKSTPLADNLLVGLQHLRPTALMAQFPTLTHAQAKRLKARLDVSRAAMMRAFREKRLSDGRRRSADELKGPLAQSTGPTFENQFRPSWGNSADPQAVDATISPAAYLIDLLLFVQLCLESEADEDRALSLRARRPDLFELMVDAQTMNQQVTQVELVIHVLQKLIKRQQAANDLTQIEDKLLAVRYPPRLFPYEAYWAQIRTVLGHSKVHLSEVSRLSDTQAPYFIRPGAHSAHSDDALLQDTSMGPLLRQMLLEVPYFEEGTGVQLSPRAAQLHAMHKGSRAGDDDEKPSPQETFFKHNFGVQGFHNLQNVVNFYQALQIDQPGMEQLFALADHTPLRSPNVPVAATGKWASASQAGARFINSGGGEPVGVGSKDGDETQHEFHFLTAARCDRLNRLVRVASALGLAYAQADQLLCAAIDGETRSVIERSRGRLTNVDGPMVITPNTLRSLGLFQFLRERFAMADTPESLARFTEGFSALLSGMSIYGTSTASSLFDQVFNGDGPNALVLDDQPFSLAADDSASKRTVDQLCSGLGINMETFRPLSRAIMQAQGGAGLTRSLAVVSAFYRVVWLARLLSITPVELLSLLEVLNPEGLYALQLAGKPQVSMYRNDTSQTDVVNVVHALATCVLWCQEQDIPIAWLVRQLLPLERSDVASMEVRVTLTELASKLQPFRDFNSLLKDAGVMPLNKGNWQSYLVQIVDGEGLISDSGSPEEDFDPVKYEDFAKREIQAVIKRLQPQEDDPGRSAEDAELPELMEDEAEHLTSLILGVVLRVRLQQWGVVQEQLAQLFGLESNMIVPVIYWAESNVHQWMASAVAFDPGQLDSRELEIILPLERRMQTRAEVARRFTLSPALFSSLLVRVHRQRLSIPSLDLTFATLYYLERYTRLLRMAKQSEAQLLGYFALVEALGEMTDNERRLVKDAAAEKIANWLGCGIREVLDVASLVAADGIIRNLGQLCALLDTRELCRRTGLSAASLMKLSQLGPGSDIAAFRAAAEEMLSSLLHSAGAPTDDEELRQSLSTRCTATSLRLVANVVGHKLEQQYEEHEKRTTLTLTLLDMNNSPVSDIRVNWSTDQGVLLDHFSYTDEQGRAEVTLQAGNTQGVANVKARYLLDSEAFAPPVVIDCDDATLRMWAASDRPQEPWLPAGNQGTYTLRFQLVDQLDNVGGDRPVHWSTSIGRLVDSDGTTATDHEGYSTMRVQSMAAGTGIEHQLADPHAIALHAPSHYRKAVFMQQVQLLIGEADLLYRRQTRDSLANAWLLYNMAADLMGEAPNARAIDTWQPKTVDALLEAFDGGQMRLLEHAHALQPADLPKQLETFVWCGAAAHPAFRAPANQQLLDTWGVLARRFHNLRHFLTLDGQPMQLPLYEAPANPFDLLLARMGGNASLAHLQGYRTVVPPYRFRTLLAKAQETVASLIQFAELLRGFMEMEDRINQEQLQFSHAAEIAEYAISMQQQLYEQQRKNHDVLTVMQAGARERHDHYKKLYDENVSVLETTARIVAGESSAVTIAGSVMIAKGYLMNTPPNIFGVANGGQQLGNPLIAAGTLTHAAGSAVEVAAKNMQDTEMYRRRRQDWQLQYKQAEKELQVLDKQLAAQALATQAAHDGYVHSCKARDQAKAMVEFYTKRSTNGDLYKWLRTQATTWLSTLFDVAVSLCNSAEACWQFESGRYDKRIIRTTVWQADRRGLNAGGELRLDLQRLEAEALLRNERHLEIRKTVSLQQLLLGDEQLLFDKNGDPIKDWAGVLKALSSDDGLALNLSQSLFDRDYPGHYMRRLHSVAVTLPALLGPYQNICATLTQTQSSLMIRPDIAAVNFLTPQAQRDGDGRNVMISLRSHQQVCLSTGNQDLGLVTAADADDRYLPFEGTGAVSSWHLQFPLPDSQKALLEGLSDIVLDVRYFALPGGVQFTRDVTALLAPVRITPAPSPLSMQPQAGDDHVQTSPSE